MSHQFHRIHNSESAGLPAPVFLYQPADLSGPGGHSHWGHAPAEPHLSRIKLAAASSIVLQLWSNFTAVFTQFSVTLQQMTTSANYLEHRNRFLNQFAATTLIRYMTAALQVFRLLQVLQLDLNSLSVWHLADVLIAGSMARRSDGSGPKTSIAIKAMRWCYKQLQIQTFQEVGNSIISSFDKEKFPTDRRESLPLPLFVIMRWERRILQSNSSIKEIVILGVCYYCYGVDSALEISNGLI